jgi:ankyrin repeat protein
MLLLLLAGVITSGCHGYSKEQQQEMQAIRDKVTADPGSINSPIERGNTYLHLAVINNYLPLMDWLKAHGADPNVRGMYGDTPLHVAIISDRTDNGMVVFRLLKMGAKVDARSNYGETPLHRAAYHGLVQHVQLLLKNRADVSAQNQRGETPLFYAVRPEGHPETVLALLKAGADVNAVDSNGMTPLHGAAMIGDVNVARILIENGKADVNRQTLAGYAPLHVAAIFGKEEFVRLLLDHGADPNLLDKRKLKPVDAAIRFPAMSYSNDRRQAVDTSLAVAVLRTYLPTSGPKPQSASQ